MQVIVITGASEGIGAEMARQWADALGERGALVLAARHAERLEAVAAECRARGAQALAVPTDVGDQAQCVALIERAVRDFGRIDLLVNNAGMSAHAMLAEVTDLAWYEKLMRINFWGAVWCTHAALPHLKASRGRIVAVSSLVGLIALPGRTAYGATKAAMNSFFDALRLELADAGVSVTIAYPGVVATEIRRRGFNAQGAPAGVSGLDEGHAMSTRVCARLIIGAAERRRREVVMTAQGKLARVLKIILPGVVDRMARAALAKPSAPST